MRLPSALVAAALLVTAACSSTPVYPDDQACSMDASLVSKLLGSDRFTADEEKLADVPLTGSVPGMTSCRVAVDDRRLLVEARVVPDATAASEKATAQEASTSFEYRGGVGYTREKAVNWSCGNVSARITLREPPEDPPDWQQLAEPVWDQIGCLTYTAPDVASQPEGWS